MVKYRVVEILWNDACRYGAYNKHGLAAIHSVGYLVHEDDIAISIAQELDKTTGEYRDSVSIPKSCIVSSVVLRKG